MQIVIDIPEGAYKALKNEGVDWLGAEHILNAVANGKLLPKCHGRLIDADYVTRDLNTFQDSFAINISNAKPGALSIACCAPTIIEADAIAESEG